VLTPLIGVNKSEKLMHILGLFVHYLKNSQTKEIETFKVENYDVLGFCVES
jgi:hypothetical protein